MNNRERMLAGKIYDPADNDILKEQQEYLPLMYEYNSTVPQEAERRQNLLQKMLGRVGEGCYIEPPFRANWGGHNLFLGDNVYANFNWTIVDDAAIYIGNNVLIGPNVTMATAGHPIEPNLRKRALQFNLDIHIGNNVWLGAGVIVLPGVTIGDNTVIGAGSVVTKDIPANTVAVGNPCRVQRKINEHDRQYYFRDKKIDIAVD